MAGLAWAAVKFYPRQVRDDAFYVAWTGVIIATAAARLGSLESSDYGGLAVAGRFLPPLWFFTLIAQAFTDFEQVRLWITLMLLGIGVAALGFWAMYSPILQN
jgi:hypothetical protein